MSREGFLELGALCPEMMKRFYGLLEPDDFEKYIDIPEGYKNRVKTAKKICDLDVAQIWSRVVTGTGYAPMFGEGIHELDDDDGDSTEKKTGNKAKEKVKTFFENRHARRKLFGKFGVR
jgi:hypothetical protein